MTRIALLVDADHWPPTSLHAIVAVAEGYGSPTLVAFGRLTHGPYAQWMGHYDRHRFERVEVDVPTKNAADRALIARAVSIADERTAEEIWVASKDKGLLAKVAVAAAGRAIVRAVEDPEARLLPPGVTWVPVDARRAPIPPEIVARLKDAVDLAAGIAGVAQLSTVRERLGRFEPRDHGRESLRDLLKDLPEDFELVDPPAGGAVTVRTRN